MINKEDIKGYFICYRVSARIKEKTSYWLAYVSHTKAGYNSVVVQEKAEDFNGPIVYKESTAKKYKIQVYPIESRLKELEKKVKNDLVINCGLTNRKTAVDDCIRACIGSMLKVPWKSINMHILKLKGYIK